MKVRCNKIDCLWNDVSEKIEGNCTRDEILIQPSMVAEGKISICSCFSRIKVRGHMDWSRFPIGGSVDDSYANKLANDKKKLRF
jgi:hypothetical protein